MTWLDEPVVRLAQRVRDGETTPVAMVDAFISRIEERNPSLNALIGPRFEQARVHAAEQTANPPAHLPPLWGVPITVKEFIEVEAMPNTAGLTRRRGSVAQAHSPLVDRLHEAGAIVLGVSNAPEVGLWTETVNRVYGRTNNPHDLRRTPGGSSGGEAALVASGASPLGIGTDIGGSVRLPAFCCGIFAHKPTAGVVPNVGLFPRVDGDTGRLHSAGPMARSVDDLELVLDVLAGSHDADPLSHGELPDRTIDSPHEVTVLIVDSLKRPRISKAVRSGMHAAANALEARGAKVRAWHHPALDKGFDLWAAVMEEYSGDASFRDTLGDGKPVSPLREALKLPLGRSDFILPSVVLLLLEGAFARLPNSRRKRLLQTAVDLRDELEAAMGPNGVLLYPSYSRTAPRHRRMMLRPFDFACTGLFNALEMPATQVPAGRARDGMPLGLQVVAPRGADRNALHVARWLEQDLGGWVKPR